MNHAKAKGTAENIMNISTDFRRIFFATYESQSFKLNAQILIGRENSRVAN